ncbi:MAG: hypothetical protein QM771_20280 [Nitrospira sp.]
MSKHKGREKRRPISIDGMIVNAIDQGLLRSAATAGQQVMEQVLKTDPEVKSLMESLVKQRLKHVLRKLGDKGKA